MKMRILLLGLLSLFMVTQSIAAKRRPCDATLSNPCVVEEIDLLDAPILSLRHSPDIKEFYQGNCLGLEHLHTSASSVPTEAKWAILYRSIRNYHPAGPIYVVDLREESHGYVNGLPYTLMERHNWINLGKSDTQVEADEKYWLQAIASQRRLEQVLTAEHFYMKMYDHGKSKVIKSVRDEKTAVVKAQFIYKRLHVSDHQAPRPAVVDQFLRFYEQLPTDAWVHFHCRGGKGRSTTFLAMVDMLHNADQVSFDEIIARQASIIPYYNLARTVRDDPDLSPYYQARYQFLKVFYDFARARLAGYSGSWSDWLNS